MKERKQFTKEFKQGAIRLITKQGRTNSDVAQSLGISPWTLSRCHKGDAHGRRGCVSWAWATHASGTRELRAEAEGQAVGGGARYRARLKQAA